ncbi:MAG: Maf family protein [Varibaculum sp.]|nr:Maf family protein [Varibaculum sp.]
MKVVLASSSPARLRTLRDAGIIPEVRVSNVDEEAVVAALPADTGFPQQVMALARAKAHAVAVNPEEIVIGADSMLEVGGHLVGKPHSAEVARQRIREMVEPGMRTVLHTGHCVRLQQREMVACSHAEVFFAPITEAEIDAYVATGEPLEVAGSFTIDGRGGAFVESIAGDYHGVVGLSLPLLRKMCSEIGVFWPDLWN